MVLSKSFQLEKIVQGKDTKGMAVPKKPDSLKVSAWKRIGAIAIGTKSSVSSSNMCGGGQVSPHMSKQFLDTSWVTYNLAQFRHCLSGNSTRFHRLRASPTRLPPTPPTSDANCNSRLLPVLLNNWL